MGDVASKTFRRRGAFSLLGFSKPNFLGSSREKRKKEKEKKDGKQEKK